MSIFPLRIHFLFGALFVASICSDTIFAQANPVAPKNSQPVQATASTTSQPVGTAAATPISALVQALPATSGSASSLPVLSAEPSGVTGGGAGASGDYILKPGDTIEMVIFHEPDLSIRSRLGKDGMVQLPLLGEVKLAGSTIRSATKMLHDKYNADYIVEPQIYLNIASFNSRKFTIIGQVQRPGTYEFSGGEDLGLLEAIGMAGGFTRIADRGHLIVKRKDGDNVKSLKVNAKKIASDGKDKFLVEPGDVINVGESWY